MVIKAQYLGEVATDEMTAIAFIFCRSIYKLNMVLVFTP